MAVQIRQYGLLLPHFGSGAKPDHIIGAAVEAERLGFDSLWVRDHLIYHPHAYEDQDRTFIDPIVVLSAIAAVTRTITLATGSLIPHRHPIHTAVILASLDYLAGSGRVLTGWELGTYDHEFEAIGIGDWDRRELLSEHVEILRKLWTGEGVAHAGKHYTFDNVDIHPSPRHSIPIWYCGTSMASTRRAVEYCDGWIPGRMPRYMYARRMEQMRRIAEQSNRTNLPHAGIIPLVSPGKTREEASRMLDLPMLLAATEQRYGEPPFGRTGRLEDLDGAVIAGPADVIIDGVRKYQEEGGLHFVFDLRARVDDWDECAAFLGQEVLPKLKRGDPAPPIRVASS